jgi:hypothetical protein
LDDLVNDESFLNDLLHLAFLLVLAVLRKLRGDAEAELFVYYGRLLLEGLLLGDLVRLFEELQLGTGEAFIPAGEARLLAGGLGLAELQLGGGLRALEFAVVPLQLSAFKEGVLRGGSVNGLSWSIALQDLRHRAVVLQHLPIKL